jgi:hypothetical protein
MPSQKCHFDAGVRLCPDLTLNQRVTRSGRSSKTFILGACQGSRKGVRLSGYLKSLESTGWRGVRRNFPDQYGGIATLDLLAVFVGRGIGGTSLISTVGLRLSANHATRNASQNPGGTSLISTVGLRQRSEAGRAGEQRAEAELTVGLRLCRCHEQPPDLGEGRNFPDQYGGIATEPRLRGNTSS